uniref:AT-rich interactive domain-containing protein 3 n=1 Tax=Chelonoidis abingdonii TaxID=106734 RepID=A0A8C0J1H8_CHEAB
MAVGQTHPRHMQSPGSGNIPQTRTTSHPERPQANSHSCTSVPELCQPLCGAISTGGCESKEGDCSQIWGMEPLAQSCLAEGNQPFPHPVGATELYELDDDPKRKEFLDDLFGFMQKRGTPVNRIPIMAKQVLDLYVLYRLVTEKGGLVEVINKKIWREITKGLNLPTSITSAAFTLRTQYMKYLYPYECEKQALSSPGELQAAIDSNRREGRRQSFGTALFIGHRNCSLHSQSLSGPSATGAILPSPPLALWPGCQPLSPFPLPVVPEDGILSAAVPSRITIPVSLAAALEQLREKLETGEPPEKKMTLMACLVSHIGLSFPPDDRQETALNLSTNGISSINMSIEINGVVYTVSPWPPAAPVAQANQAEPVTGLWPQIPGRELAREPPAPGQHRRDRDCVPKARPQMSHL